MLTIKCWNCPRTSVAPYYPMQPGFWQRQTVDDQPGNPLFRYTCPNCAQKRKRTLAVLQEENRRRDRRRLSRLNGVREHVTH